MIGPRTTNRRWLLGFVLLCLSHSLSDCAVGDVDTASTSPHIVLIMVDDMGYGDLACYNADSKIETPHLNQLAAQSLRFTDAHAPGPLCHLSRYGLLTGRYPFRTNVGVWRKQAVIAPEQTTIASLLKRNGYATSMVGKWHLGFDENGYDNPLPGGPVDRGFDQYFGIRASTDIPPYFYIRNRKAVQPPTNFIAANTSDGWSPIQGAFWRAGGISPDLKLHEVLPMFTEEAVHVIKTRDQQRPLFLYLAYPAPHTPWLPSAEFRGKSEAGMYGDFVMMVDAMIGKVLKALEEANMTEDTLVIFTSDNGPVWYESDVNRLGHDSSGGLRGMKADAWENGHRMPFLVRWPGKTKPNSSTQQTICFTDLLATFAAVTGDQLKSGEGPDSFNLLPVLLGEQPEDEPIRGPLPIASGNRTMTLRDGDWKLIQGLGSGGFTKPARVKPGPDDPAGQLYHLANDPAEQTNLYQEFPDRVAEMTAKLKTLMAAETTRAEGTDPTAPRPRQDEPSRVSRRPGFTSPRNKVCGWCV